MIKLDNISFDYSGSIEKRRPLFKDFSLMLKKGEYAAVGGVNGSGKTTLAALIKGMIRPLAGEIYYEGKNVTKLGINPEIGYIFSNAENQIVSPVVEDDVAFGLEYTGVRGEDIEGAVRSSLLKVDALYLQKELTHLLSGGEQQKINIAGILALKCKCIIFDEASSMLDPLSRRALLKILKELNRQYEITIIQITHNLFELMNSDRVIYLQNGRLLFDGTCDKLFENESACQSFTEKQRSLVTFMQEMKKITGDPSLFNYNMNYLVDVLSQHAGKSENDSK